PADALAAERLERRDRVRTDLLGDGSRYIGGDAELAGPVEVLRLEVVERMPVVPRDHDLPGDAGLCLPREVLDHATLDLARALGRRFDDDLRVVLLRQRDGVAQLRRVAHERAAEARPGTCRLHEHRVAES